MEEFHYHSLIIYNSVYEYIDSNMYIILEGNDAIIIDPHKNEDALKLLKNNGISNVVIMLTHEHCDHISGIYYYEDNFNAKILCSEECAMKISSLKHNRPLFLYYILEENDVKNGTNILEKFKSNYELKAYSADITFKNNYTFQWKNHEIELFSIKGHSPGSVLILFDKNLVFTGDSLLEIYPVITRFPNSDKEIFMNKSIPVMESLINQECCIFPGHGMPFEAKKVLENGKLKISLR